MQQQQQQHGQEGYYGTSPDGMNPTVADSVGDPYAAGQVTTSGMSPLQRQPNVMGDGGGGGGGEGAAAGLDHPQQQGVADGTGDAAANGGGDAADGAEDGWRCLRLWPSHGTDLCH